MLRIVNSIAGKIRLRNDSLTVLTMRR